MVSPRCSPAEAGLSLLGHMDHCLIGATPLHPPDPIIPPSLTDPPRLKQC